MITALITIIVTLTGCIVWIVKRLVDKTLPEQQSMFQKECQEQRKFAEDQMREDRTMFKDELERNREEAMHLTQQVIARLERHDSDMAHTAARINESIIINQKAIERLLSLSLNSHLPAGSHQ